MRGTALAARLAGLPFAPALLCGLGGRHDAKLGLLDRLGLVAALLLWPHPNRTPPY